MSGIKKMKKKIINTCFFCNGAADFVHLQWWSSVSPFYGEKIGLCWNCYTERTEKLLAAYKNIVEGVTELEHALEMKENG